MSARILLLGTVLLSLAATNQVSAQQQSWKFMVSGDSRNCGDVVMPAIAKRARDENAAFYWHLGDYRAIFRFDQDYAQLHKPKGSSDTMSISVYLSNAWQDFIENQLEPFGNVPVFLAFGNHELTPPKTREELIAQFSDWLDAAPIREQRLRDNPHDHRAKGHYHWMRDGIDFITLDNASPDQFDAQQLKWIHSTIDRDQADPAVRAVVVGMHEALPESIGTSHSMDQFPVGQESGKKVYRWLVDFRRESNKPVYVLASHSHFYMEGIFNTPYWKDNGGILPGWIVGTAGAERYALPPKATDAKAAKTNVYGYLVGIVSSSKEEPVRFEFRELSESDVPADVVQRFTPDFVHECWTGNSLVH